MPWTTALTEFRQFLADTDKHKRSSMKKVIGRVDGSNIKFRTFDKRILASTFECQVDGLPVDASVDDPISGEITIGSAPNTNSKVTASYYWQWWLDAELKTFLNKGAEETGFWTSTVPDNAYTIITPGLKSAALTYGAAWALDSLIFYLSNRRHSAEFVIEEDGNTDANDAAMIDAMRRQSEAFKARADIARDDYWKRLGKRNAPAFGVKTVSQRQYGSSR